MLLPCQLLRSALPLLEPSWSSRHPAGTWDHAEPCPGHAPLPLVGRTHPAAGVEQGTPVRCSHSFSAAAPLLSHYWSTNRSQPGRSKLLVRWIRESEQQLGQIMAFFLLRWEGGGLAEQAWVCPGQPPPPSITTGPQALPDWRSHLV